MATKVDVIDIINLVISSSKFITYLQYLEYKSTFIYPVREVLCSININNIYYAIEFILSIPIKAWLITQTQLIEFKICFFELQSKWQSFSIYCQYNLRQNFSQKALHNSTCNLKGFLTMCFNQYCADVHFRRN